MIASPIPNISETMLMPSTAMTTAPSSIAPTRMRSPRRQRRRSSANATAAAAMISSRPASRSSPVDAPSRMAEIAALDHQAGPPAPGVVGHTTDGRTDEDHRGDATEPEHHDRSPAIAGTTMVAVSSTTVSAISTQTARLAKGENTPGRSATRRGRPRGCRSGRRRAGRSRRAGRDWSRPRARRSARRDCRRPSTRGPSSSPNKPRPWSLGQAAADQGQQVDAHLAVDDRDTVRQAVTFEQPHGPPMRSFDDLGEYLLNFGVRRHSRHPSIHGSSGALCDHRGQPL